MIPILTLLATFGIGASFVIFFQLSNRGRTRSLFRITATVNKIAVLTTVIEIFHRDTGRYPTTPEGLTALVHPSPGSPGWKGPYLDKVPVDGWGRPYLYICPGTLDPTTYDLSSFGADGQQGTDDDIDKNTTDWTK